jgi:hypothetical protein
VVAVVTAASDAFPFKGLALSGFEVRLYHNNNEANITKICFPRTVSRKNRHGSCLEKQVLNVEDLSIQG